MRHEYDGKKDAEFIMEHVMKRRRYSSLDLENLAACLQEVDAGRELSRSKKAKAKVKS